MDEKNIDQLQWEVSNIQKSLNELKSKTLSEAEKKTKTEEIKNKAETTKQAIQSKIDQLKDKTDADSVSEREKAETLLKTVNDIITLQLSIWEQKWDKSKDGGISTWEKPAETTASTWDAEWEKKWFLKKTWAWIWDQWSDVISWDKWKEEPWKNILRAVGFWVTWYALYKWAKKLWNWAFWKDKKKKEKSWWETESETKEDSSKESDEKPFWKRPVWKFIKWAGAVLWVWTWVYYVAHGLYTKNRWLNDLWDREKGKKLDFNTALGYCKWAISNQDNKEGMSYGMDLKYHEDTWEIEAYWERIKIDKEKRKIVWLWDVEFKKYEHMINTAILIAYLKKEYSSQCKNNSPFYLTGSWQWDINVNMWNSKEEAVDWTWNWGRIVWVTAGWIAGIVTWIFGWLKAWTAVWITWWIVWYGAGSLYDHNNIMNDHMPELDNEYWKKCLQSYLNEMWCRQARNQTKEDLTESPIKDKVREFVNQIQKDNPDLPAIWWRMKFDAIQDPKDKNKYTIKAYWREIKAEITWGKWSENMRILEISWWTPQIKCDTSVWNLSNLKISLKEWLYMTALIGQFVEKYHHKGVWYPYFNYTWKWQKIMTGMWKFYTFQWKEDYKWIYFNDKERTANIFSWEFWSVDSMAYSRQDLKRNMPTIFKDDDKFEKTFIKFLNDGITDDQNVSIWKKN